MIVLTRKEVREVDRRAIEDYAQAAGFRTVFYHMFPLNRVPLRFVHHLASVGLPVGTSVGASVGASGKSDGAPVGTSVGASLGMMLVVGASV